MPQPKVSIVIPVYNTSEYLHECLDSVIKQTLRDIEIICVNDGSTDDSLQIIKEYAAEDSRIKVIDKPNGGYGSAMNAGLKQVTGRYIGIVEPDDFIKPEMYATLYNLAEQYKADIVKTEFMNYFDVRETEGKEGGNSKVETEEEKLKRLKNAPMNGWFNKNRPYPEKPFTISECPSFLYFHPSIWSCIYKTDFIRKNRIDFQEIKGAGWADNLFQVKSLVLAKRIFYYDKAYYYYRRRNWDDAKDLKDYTIPFKRTHEIHQWLSERKINDDVLLACLMKRELAYIGLVFRGQKKEKFEDIKPYLKEYLSEINPDLLKNQREYSTSFERKFMKKLSVDLDEAYDWYCKKMAPSFLNNLREFRKKVISIHLTKNVKHIMLFGFKLL